MPAEFGGQRVGPAARKLLVCLALRSISGAMPRDAGYVHSSQIAARNPLSLRPSGDARAAAHPAPPGTALPHACAQLFAEGHAPPALCELAAGPGGQLGAS